MNMREIYSIQPDDYGWRRLSNGHTIHLGDNVRLGDRVRLGDNVCLGDNVLLGDNVRLEDEVRLGKWVRLEDEVRLGKWVRLGDYVRLEDGVQLSDNVRLGDDVRLGERVTSEALAEQFRAMWLERGNTVVLTKWVTQNRESANFDGGAILQYPVGAEVWASDAEASDQQCAPGLHALEHGHRPEWYGLCAADHHYMPIDVKVETRHILFGGLPTMRGKLRVRKLKVLT